MWVYVSDHSAWVLVHFAFNCPHVVPICWIPLNSHGVHMHYTQRRFVVVSFDEMDYIPRGIIYRQFNTASVIASCISQCSSTTETFEADIAYLLRATVIHYKACTHFEHLGVHLWDMKFKGS